MIKLERILVPTDFSDHSRKALDYAIEFARHFRAEAHLLHVIESPVMAVPGTGAPVPQELLDNAKEEAEASLDDWISDAGEGIEMTRSVVLGAAFVEIVQYAKENEFDLIVMATHGRTGLAHALLGSVAEKVTRKAPCAVLTVRAEGHQFVMP